MRIIKKLICKLFGHSKKKSLFFGFGDITTYGGRVIATHTTKPKEMCNRCGEVTNYKK